MKKIAKTFGIAIVSSFLSFLMFYFFVIPPKVQNAEISSFESKSRIIPTTYSYSDAAYALEPTDFVEVASDVVNKVVHIKSIRTINSTWYRRSSSASVVGSGVIVSPDGYLITNYHVIENNNGIEVTLNDNRTFKGEIIKVDPDTDLAILKIEPENLLPYMVFGDSDNAQIGEWVLTVGNPLNLTSTVTAGIISAKSRDSNLRDNKNEVFIQTDAAVNIGNSGGALVNTQGELIGINTKISTQTGGYVGYSFAIPSNIVRKVFEDLMEYGDIQKGILGVSGNSLTGKSAEQLQIQDTEGFYISEVFPETGASQANLKPGDIIKTIDGNKINKYADLHGRLFSKRPGDQVNITYKRNDQLKNVIVTLTKSVVETFGGMEIREVKPQKEDNYSNGALIISNVSRLSLSKYLDYRILEINDFKVENIDDIRAIKRRNEEINTIKVLSPEGEQVTLVY
ncbi:MAG: trypsin-like peptidase domain-containing protein [Flavobacteriaceae bacterium]|nr:trypsin-like peptidase domain-containing protein [Flavobacteriaceae bacterium]MCY4215975.1 trypsin-like peptidase domain-containing protein [Flavobacteriaceae bacterium]MCY4253239.1 trypsin-like peptidase domain-containing protein [Flavobacteriaceae bacterium]